MTWHSTRKTYSNCIHRYILNRVMEDLKCLQIQHTCKQQAKNEIKILKKMCSKCVQVPLISDKGC